MFAQVLLYALGLLSPVTLEWVVLPQAGEKEGPLSFCGLSLDVLFAAPPCLDTSLPFIRQHGTASDNPAVATPGTDPDVDAVVNELEEYKVVVRNSLGSHTLLMGATIKAVDPRYEPGSPKGYVVFRTQRMFPTDRRWFNFRRHKLLEWWSYSVPIGVPRVICGFRDDDGIVQSVREFQVHQMPEEARVDESSSSRTGIQRATSRSHQVCSR
ncbi:decapping and exoribonuclease protein-like isoform X2 [Rhipicephalus microplus]|uniref:decapping and exoribonuclease protein-like isoform X2 n=1 Tax=Rhipicephalus microplus TaxID=6941 RepID=UPI003F6D928C